MLDKNRLERDYPLEGALMTRSRAFNRFNRFVAKRRRTTLRTAVPSLSEDFSRLSEDSLHVKELRKQAWQDENLLDFSEID